MALSEAQQAELIAAMKGKNPDQLQLPGVLWDRAAVRALIEKLSAIKLLARRSGCICESGG